MIELLSLNIFAEFLLAALLGVALFFGLLALPMFVSGEGWEQPSDEGLGGHTATEHATRRALA